MNLVFLGPPGCGKGTQAQVIKEQLNIQHISTGDMLRESVAKGTELGKSAKNYMDKGELVPDEVIIGLVKERVSQPDCDNGFLLDGFPRTLPQATALDNMLTDLSKKLDAVVSFDVTEEELIKRLGGRRTCSGCGRTFHVMFNPTKVENVCDDCSGTVYTRDDDQPVAIKQRLHVYKEKTEPLIKYYKTKDLLKEVDATPAPEMVSKSVLQILGK